MSESNQQNPLLDKWPNAERNELETIVLVGRGIVIMVVAFGAALALSAIQSFAHWGHLSPP